MANAVLVPTPASVNEISSSKNQDAQEDSNIASSTRGSSPSLPQTSASWVSCVKSSLINQGVTGEPLNTILESWRSGTRKQYQTYVSAWVKFCSDNSVSPMNPTLQQILEFLSFQSKTVGYSAVATARSALSTFVKIDGVKVGDHPLVSRFMTGLFNQKPALPRYTETWNPHCAQPSKNFSNHWKLVSKATHSETSHAYGTPLSTENPNSPKVISGGNEYIAWKVYIPHLLSLKANQCKRWPKQTLISYHFYQL